MTNRLLQGMLALVLCCLMIPSVSAQQEPPQNTKTVTLGDVNVDNRINSADALLVQSPSQIPVSTSRRIM